ncbi:MAG: NUDIX domain-containing protein [Saprospiraceae bacterium]|nr:NUDIX domain-containing protein [Saprospiraceae bacterium]
MYKIYIGEVPLLLVSREESHSFDSTNLRNLLVDYNIANRRTLYRYIDNLEKGSKHYDSIIIVSDDLPALKDYFFSLFNVQKAGGGLVFNEKKEILAIKRLGFWDLPKGKQDEGEKILETAIREVKEETGINDLIPGDFICDTYHTYKSNTGKRILKWSVWYKMTTKDEILIPQAEEDIELAIWMNVHELKNKTPMYKNIQDLLEMI